MNRLLISSSFSNLVVGIYTGSEPRFLLEGQRLISQKSGLVDVIAEGFQTAEIALSDLHQIVVDLGPGGTSSVRTAVAFANALAYANELPILGVSSLEMLCYQAKQKLGEARTILAVAKSIGGQVYVGTITDSAFSIAYQPQTELLAYLNKSAEPLVLVGDKSLVQRITQLEAVADKAIDGEIYLVSSIGLLAAALAPGAADKASLYPKLPMPITEVGLG